MLCYGDFLVAGAPVAQLDRASASGAEGHRFKSCQAHQTELARAAGLLVIGCPRIIPPVKAVKLNPPVGR
jgi:hypothetical protein